MKDALKDALRKLPWFLVAITLAATFVSGCAIGAGGQDGASGEAAVSFTDALGRAVSVSSPKRVVAMSYSFADTWLLAGGELAGTTRDAFASGLRLPETVADVGALHAPSLERVIELDPDLLILSADIPAHLGLQETLEASGVNAAYFSVLDFADYLGMLKTCTEITGRADLYERNGAAVQARIDGAVAGASGKPSPRILLLRVSSGNIEVRGSDTMAGIMLKDLGCANIADSDASLLESLSMEAIISEDPDFIFVVQQGDSLEDSLAFLEKALTSNPAWAGLSAVKNGRFEVVAKELFHQKPNDRWGEAYETLASILYGEP